jgi:hypothetical protein
MGAPGKRGAPRCAEQARAISARVVARIGTPHDSGRGGSDVRKRVRK